MKQSPKNLIDKFLRNELTQEEAETLITWMERPENKAFLKQEIQLYHLIHAYCMSFDAEKAYNTIVVNLKDQSKTKVLLIRRPWLKYAAAAILVIALASTYFLRDTIFNSKIENTTPIIVNNQIEPGTDKATLTLETGETVALEKGTQFQTQNATSNGEEIIYESGKRNKAEVAYNTLTIPRGGQFYIVLSDGTKVWLNSESQLKYPVTFIDGYTRQVELIYGEAYFDVSPSTEHNGSKFKVNHHAQEVEVLGTEFNIKAYKDETNVYTTLVEGEVAVNHDGNSQILAPTQQSILNTQNNNLNIVVVDVYRESSWKQGVFSFERKPLKEIMKVLSRWYDMDVVFENKKLETIGFIGTFNKNRSIEDILLVIQNANFINGYEINNKTLFIK